MKHIILTIMYVMSVSAVLGQEFDITLTGAESGTKTHYARNTILFDYNYSYTPNGGTLTAEIQNPVVTGDISYSSFVNPSNRSLNTSYMVGATNGAFNVSPIGGATYTIPLEVPSGIGGLQPGLSISYNSMGGAGIVGYGWNISGISAVTRSHKTYHHDGSASGVELSTNDRFSLDGQRLICTSGSYGANGSQYRTENDIFTRVTCYSSTYGPTQFLAETKAGLDCQYGYDADADQTIEGHNEIVNWYLNKITDVYGNQINYEYFRDNDMVYLAEITYGPNTITFYYEQREDRTTNYLKGSKIELGLLLDKIEMKYNSNVVKKYEFRYNYPSSNYTRYSVLNEVIEYGIGTSRMNSTAFSYQTPDNVAFTQTEYNSSHAYVTYKSELVAGDYNGDGKTDFLCIPRPDKGATWTGLRVYYGDGNDNFNYGFSETTVIDYNTLDDIRAIDLNGDGRDDILYETVNSGTSTFRYMRFDGTSFTSPYLVGNYPHGAATGNSGKTRRVYYRQEDDNEFSGADYNGDGIADIFLNDPNGGWRIFSLTNSSNQLTTGMYLKGSGTISTLADEVLSGDFNGDGKADIWSFQDDGVKIYTFNGSGLTEIYSSTWPSKNHFFNLGDFNSDGKVDVFLYGYKNGGTEYDWSDWQVQLSTGTGFEKKFIPKKKNNLKDDYVRLGDFNGDGTTDLMVSSADQSWTGTYFYITKNEGSDFYSHFLANYPPASHNYYVADYNGDGRTDFMCTDGASAWWNGYQLYRGGTKNKMLMTNVANGLNHLTEISYRRLSEVGSPYTKGTGAVFPVMDFQGSLPVVSSVLNDNGRGSQNTTNYAYQGAKIHQRGKGFLCYSSCTVTDVANNMSSENNYDYNTTYYYPKLASTISKEGTNLMSTANNTWSHITTATGVFMPYISISTQTNNLTGHSATTSFSYDTYGNPTEVEKAYNNGATETTTNTYSNDPTNWYFKLTSSEIEYTKSGETTVNHTISYTYSTDGKLKPDYIKYNEGTGLYYYKNHDYNSYGNLTKITEYGSGVGTRETNYTYETNAVRLKIKTDPFVIMNYSYDTYGRLSSEVESLGNVTNATSYTYDNMGRTVTETTSDGFVTTNNYNWGLSGGPTYACYNIQTSGNDGSLSKTWYDELGRGIRSDVKNFDGSYIYTVTDYNTKGQVYRISEPSSSTSPSQWNTNTYDTKGRIDYIDRPSGMDTDFSYSSNRVTTTTGGKTSWKETDSQGLVTLAHDNGGDITYTYYPDRKVKTITAPGNVVTSMEYNDAARNQTKLIDPSAGTIEYTYNAYGQLKTQKNGRNQTTTYNYLSDGRPSSRVTPEGTTSYSYNSNKQLYVVTSPGTIQRVFGYDTRGRVIGVSEIIPGHSTFSTSFTYDTKGRLSTRTHPSGIVETLNYNTNGYLSSISAGGQTRYTITGVNHRQQITSATYGSELDATFGFDDYGYPTYEKAMNGANYRKDFRYNFNITTGNLSSRQDYMKGNTESFTYDNLDRLTSASGPQSFSMTYGANGNIESKSDLGTGEFEYNITGKPYALSGVENTSALFPIASQYATYTSFEQVDELEEGLYTAKFYYNDNNQRCKMEVKQGTATILTKWYVGSHYIKEIEGSTTTQYTWIGGDAYSAPVVAITQNGTTTYYSLLRDYLGNITHQAVETGGVAAAFSYDAWGRRRDKDDWGYTLTSEPDLIADRGFTSHEYLPWFRLVNMNGRLYDPLVGRMLSPDNYVQAAEYTQGFNRYSYCYNNPLKYRDPSGEFLTWSFGKGGFSIGFNLTPIGIPLGAGINIGWEDGASLGGYGEVGYRVGGTGLGTGATVSQGLDYNFKHNNWSTTTSEGAYASLGPFNAGANFSQTYDITNSQWNTGWGVSAGIGFGNDGRGIGFNVGYGSSGFTYGMGGYFNSKAWDSNPEFNPEVYYDCEIEATNNCYSYAIDDPYNNIDGKPQPGDYAGRRIECYPPDLNEIIIASVADGFIKKPNFFNKLGFGKRGYYSVYLVMDNVDAIQDYHWYRQDKGGLWSQKHGASYISNLDGSGQLIRNPARANHNYGTYPGYGSLNYSSGGIYLWVKRR